jgi:alpha-tubulin suppressor-like RCC1 family protein
MGQLGHGKTESTTEPVRVSGLGTDAVSVEVGGDFSCATVGVALYCWGTNRLGQLGIGTTTDALVPAQTLNWGVESFSAGGSQACASNSISAKCWGNNSSGQLGNGESDITQQSLTPVAVQGLSSSISAITCGSGHSCAISNGRALCWGSNSYGQLGDGGLVVGNAHRPTAGIVKGMDAGVTAISAGVSVTCAIRDGGVYCWGDNASGALGSGTEGGESSSPVPVLGVASGATAISVGYHYACAIVAGAAMCWGNNDDGALGTNSASSTNAPVPVVGLPSGVTAISAGARHACAIKDGRAYCWGGNHTGKLGNGTILKSPIPILVQIPNG